MGDKFENFVDFLEQQAQRAGMDWALTFGTEHETAWSGRLTLTPRWQHDQGLTEGIVLCASAGGAPDDVLAVLEPRARAVLEERPVNGGDRSCAVKAFRASDWLGK